MSKRADSLYRSGRGKDWLKIKCLKGEEFVIGGYSRSSVKGKPFSSLLLGTFEDGKLIYSGKVGTGFDSADFDRLARKFEPLARKSSSFEEVPSVERKDAVWLEPKLVAEIAFTERTRDGRLRHPSFKGLREDKPAREVHREQRHDEEADMATTTRSSAGRKGDATFAGITLSNPDKVYYPGAGITKLDLARYYETVAPFMLPYAVKRPISLVRCPGRNRRRALLPAPCHEGHEQRDQADSHFRRREQEALSLHRRRPRPVRAGADRHARDPRLGRVARPYRQARSPRVRSRSRRRARSRHAQSGGHRGPRFPRRSRFRRAS